MRRQIERQLESLQEQVDAQAQQIISPRVYKSRAERLSQLEHRIAMSSTQSADLRQLVREANVGTGPRDAYRRSDAQHLEGVRKKARHRRLWLRIGLEEIEDSWDQRAAALDAGTDLMLAKKPTDGAGLFLAWLEAVKERPDLKLDEFDPVQVCKFFLDSNGSPSADAVPSDEKEIPAMAAAVAVQRADHVPLDLWLLSGRDLLLKGALAAALLLAAMAGFATWKDSRARQQRERRRRVSARRETGTSSWCATASATRIRAGLGISGGGSQKPTPYRRGK